MCDIGRADDSNPSKSLQDAMLSQGQPRDVSYI